MRDIRLNFINNSDDQNNSQIVIFQKNSGITPIAWQVIEHAGKGWHHPFVYSETYSLEVEDDFGNFSNMVAAEPGQQWKAIAGPTGHELVMTDEPTQRRGIEVMNDISYSPIRAHLYRSGKKVASVFLPPGGARYVFEFQPTITIAVMHNAKEGIWLPEQTEEWHEAEISLLGIVSADIVMTGGGSGDDAAPIVFTVQNISHQ